LKHRVKQRIKKLVVIDQQLIWGGNHILRLKYNHGISILLDRVDPAKSIRNYMLKSIKEAK
jgi:hypothetical protein